MNLEKAFKEIFPNGKVNLFLHYWNNNKCFKNKKERLDFSLYCYGEIREDEYKKEKINILRCIK